MTDVITIAFCVVLLAAIILALVLVYYWRAAITGYVAAQDIAHASEQHQLEAERQRDDEHTARLAAEAARDDLAKQVAATQAALNSITKEHLDAIHDAVARGDADSAIAVIRGVFSQLPDARPPGGPAPAGGGAAATAVQPAGGGAGANVAHADPGAGR